LGSTLPAGCVGCQPQLLAFEERDAVQRRVHQHAHLQRGIVAGLALQCRAVDGPLQPPAPGQHRRSAGGQRQLVHQVAIAAVRLDAQCALAVECHDREARARQALLRQQHLAPGRGRRGAGPVQRRQRRLRQRGADRHQPSRRGAPHRPIAFSDQS
jgi:hypothetical protein